MDTFFVEVHTDDRGGPLYATADWRLSECLEDAHPYPGWEQAVTAAAKWVDGAVEGRPFPDSVNKVRVVPGRVQEGGSDVQA